MKRENNGSSVCPPYTQFAQFQYSFEFVFMITHFSRKNNYIIVLSMRKDKGDSKYKYLAMSDKAPACFVIENFIVVRFEKSSESIETFSYPMKCQSVKI